MSRSRPSTAMVARTTNGFNTDYENTVRKLCAPEYLKSGLSWLRYAGDKEKQGLRILAAVIKHRGTKKFRNKPKESVTQTIQKTVGTRSVFNLTNADLEKYKQEYKKNMYKSAYGAAFGRNETDVADTKILKYKKFNELPSTKILDKTVKTFIARWSDIENEKSYVSLAILVVKSIYTHWKQSLPTDTVSHLKHSGYDPHDVIHHPRMDKIANKYIMERTKKSMPPRPQTTGNLLRRKGKSSATLTRKVDKNKGMDDIIQNRKKFLLRGNGNITGFYNPPEGMVSSYQTSFKPSKSSMLIQRTAGNMYTSSIMTVTPDPNLFQRAVQKQDKLREDVLEADKRLTNTNNVLHRAMDRAMGYENDDIRDRFSSQMSKLRQMQGNAGQQYRNGYLPQSRGGYRHSGRTPMPVRVQNLMEPMAN